MPFLTAAFGIMYCNQYYCMLFWILFYGRIGRIRPLIEALVASCCQAFSKQSTVVRMVAVASICQLLACHAKDCLQGTPENLSFPAALASSSHK